MKLKFIIFIFILFCIINLQAAKPLSVDVGIENGYFKSDILGDRLLIRLIGRVTYSQKFENNFINIKGRISPEFYGSPFDASAYKLGGEINLGGKFKSFHWQTSISSRNYYYRSDRFNDVTFNIFQIGLTINRTISDKVIISGLIDYFYRDNAEQPRNKIDSYQYTISGMYRLNQKNSLSFDLCVETFIIDRISTVYPENKNEGIRIGPALRFNHRSKHLLNLSYALMHHTSEIFTSDYWEHRINVLWGHYLTKKWSVFLFANYLFKPDQHPDDTMIELTYTPANNETGYHFKLGYDISKRAEIYVKIGYTKDELLYQNTDLAGWQYLLGMNFRF